MEIITGKLDLEGLKRLAAARFGDMIKAVVDIDKEIVAVDAELHSDLEALLLDKGSKQKDLWGINLYPDLQGDGFIEYDSMINVRPSQGNKSRSVDNEAVRQKIVSIVGRRISR